MKKNRVPELLLTCMALSAAMAAHGASFGHPQGQTVLGQPLLVWVPLEGDGDSPIAPNCVTADVMAGDVSLPSNQVRVQVLTRNVPGQWLARISTTSPVEEPVLRVTVSAGCSGKFSRQFVLLADPPGSPAEVATVASPVNRSTVQAQSLAHSAASSAEAPRRTVRRHVAAPVPARTAEDRVERHASNTGPVRPRLQLDVVEPSAMAASMAASAAPVVPAVQAPASSASTAAAAASAASVPALGGDAALLALRRNSDVLRMANEELRQRLDAAEQRNNWLLLGLGGVVLAMGLGGLLLWRRQRELLQTRPWWTEDRPRAAARKDSAFDHDEEEDAWLAAEPAHPLVKAGSSTFEPPSDWAPVAPASADETVPLPEVSVATEVAAAPPPAAAAPTVPFNPSATMTFGPAEAPREVSVEELLDLEQQADFFIALGQEDAAIEVLMSHLRGTGGQSPLPYTKLLEIYRRQGDRSAYERVRARFNRRFNAYAPDWDIGPMHGRVLEDYPDAVKEIQAAWGSPLDAMAVLEAMLFRRDESRELFDLPAYRDLLMLYAVARDLWQAAGGQHDQVDLLLPMLDGSPAGLPPDSEHLDLDLELAPGPQAPSAASPDTTPPKA